MFESLSAMGYAAAVVPGLVAILFTLFVGGFTVRKLLVAAVDIVYVLGDKADMNNAEKRRAAIKLLYVKFPKLATVVPDYFLGKLVDIAWEQIVKPIALKQVEAPKV